jgi:hypothetical protein
MGFEWEQIVATWVLKVVTWVLNSTLSLSHMISLFILAFDLHDHIAGRLYPKML